MAGGMKEKMKIFCLWWGFKFFSCVTVTPYFGLFGTRYKNLGVVFDGIVNWCENVNSRFENKKNKKNKRMDVA